MNYIKFYKKALNIDFDSSKYEIHHLDCNHENDDIDNLLLLPKKLHSRYHMKRPDWANLRDFPMYPMSSNKSGHNATEYCMRRTKKMIEDFLPVLSECKKWADYKEYLLGNMPNIHGLSHKEK